MNALQRTLQTIATQLKQLPPTARLLIGSLMIILVMSLFLVSIYAGQADLVPLGLGANASQQAKAQAIDYLTLRQIPFDDNGGDLLVPAEHKIPILAQLTESNVIGGDQIDFDSVLRDDSPFRTRDQSRQRYLVAKMNVLASMISQMSGIERATVVLDQPEGGAGLGRSHVGSSASVTVLPRDTELSQAQVDAIAHLISRAHAGLKPQNVAVIDNRSGRVLHARTDDAVSSGKYLEVKQAVERDAKAALQGALNHIAGVLIEVNAQVDAKEVVQQVSKVDEPKVGATKESSRTLSSNSGAAGTEPGVKPNTGAALASSSRQGSQMSDERTETSTIPVFGKTDQQIRDAKGYALQINATIGVPKSYFVRLYQDRNGGAEAAAPDQTALDAIVQVEIAEIKKYVTPLIDTQALEGAQAGTVMVSMVPDFGTVAMLVPLQSAGGEVGGGLVTDGLVKYVSLGGLAVLSLAMMFMMVKKASVRPQLPSAAELVGIPPALAAAESDLVGEADEASPALEGVELTDDAMRRQQMLDQITQMVTGSPDEAAGLLRRWIKTGA